MWIKRTFSRLGLPIDTTTHGRARAIAAATAGFTLVEMLVVLAIIGLLVGLVAPKVLGQLSEAKVKTAHIQIESFKSALDLFYLDAGRYPTTNEGFAALIGRPAGQGDWSGPYIKGASAPLDPWNHPYVYRSPGQSGRPYEILHMVPNGRASAEGAPALASW
jgi:general secretion pathway protein G